MTTNTNSLSAGEILADSEWNPHNPFPAQLRQIRNAMTDFAAQQSRKEAIAFAEWKDKHYHFHFGRDYITLQQWWSPEAPGTYYTLEQLYDIFSKTPELLTQQTLTNDNK
jgi:hypothetical protein